MRRVLLGLWLCTGLLCWVLQTGCSHGGRSNADVALKPAHLPPSEEGVSGGPITPDAKSPGLPPRLPETAAAPAASSPADGLSPVAHLAQPDGAANPLSPATGAIVSRLSQNAGMRSAPVSVHPAATRDLAYRWLVGTLEAGRGPDSWYLRYADESDPYGGRVALVPPQTLNGFQAGQLVRVQGQLVNPRNREWVSWYEVETVSSWEDSSPTAPQPPSTGSQTGQSGSGNPGQAHAQPTRTRLFHFLMPNP